MARKTRKGYYVDGVFVAADSEPGQDTPSRTDVKNASEALQDLGVDLLTLRADLLDGLRLPEQLGEAIAEAKRLTHFEAQRRQRQFIGKLMRQLDATALDAIAAALRIQRAQSSGDTRLLHEAEQWRDSLIADDERLGEWIGLHPDTDVQRLRTLIRQARKDAQAVQARSVERRGRAYREIFVLVRERLCKPA